MRQKVTIVLESNFVARWFAEVLECYGKANEVEISFACLRTSGKGGAIWEKWLPKNIIRFWASKKLENCLSPQELDQDEPLLCFGDCQNFCAGSSNANVWILEKGSDLAASGLRGWFNFFHTFFWLGHPLVFSNSKTQQRFSIFFQTRDFKLSRNLGFLRFNLEKILDFLIYDKPHGYPVWSNNDFVHFPIREYIRYPFWQFLQKIKRKVLKANWQLVKMSRKSLERFTSVDETLIPLFSGEGWADPFIADSGEGLFLFFEEIVQGKGQLSVLELNRKSLSPQGPSKTVMEKETHLSYPFVLNVDEQWYMIPENSAANDLSIYKAEAFPFEWTHFKTVFSGSKWVDTTPFFFKGKWWIFSVRKVADYGSSYQDLYLFYCDDILKDDWQVHPCNPVVSDVRHARGGGALFFYEGRLIRPAQNCHNKYGGGLQFCEVLELSEERYEERVLGEFRFPVNKPMSSFHTVALYGDHIIGDCYV
ncbi:glucosamine inositolphosphorylceramide transferase family protein [Marinilabilia rubra]|uniref:Formyl transferase n=1 Tax=Marinilabilia rubra TaxID=2162893 RepID=A0A2U2B7G5_9BACT|nr:formyl transferase [Marinilabilia rubra]PWD98992.1 formyl transferase [Marinilabilia rubra]